MAPATGEVKAVASLADVQGSTFDVPTILLAESLTGVEDIPPGEERPWFLISTTHEKPVCI